MVVSSDKIVELQSRVSSDPYDVAGWDQLLGEISRGRKSDEQTAQLREAYEDLLSKFPTAVCFHYNLCYLMTDMLTFYACI